MASGTKTLAFAACSLCSCFLAAPEAAGGTGLSPLKPPAQAAAASAALAQRPSATASSGSEQQAEPQQRARNPQRQQGSCKVQKPRRHTNEHISKSWDCITSAGAPRGVSASLPEREQRLVLLRPGPFPTPDAGKASQHAQVLRAGTSDGCRNRILCLTVPLSTHARTTEQTACASASLKKSQSRAG